MKFAILTVQGFNYGSVLQGFALKKYIESKGHEAVFIDTRKYTIRRSAITNNIPFELRKLRMFWRAWSELGTPLIGQPDENIIVGSDVVFDRDYPDVFYNRNVSYRDVAAYAPSLGESSICNLTVTDWLRLCSMGRLSARDLKTRVTLQHITQREIPMVLDPVFIIDWVQYERPYREMPDYALVYSYEWQDKEFRRRAFAIAEDRDLALVSVGNFHKWCDHNIPDAHPLEFLSYVRNAKHIVTDTFHGTALGIVYRKPMTALAGNYKTANLLHSVGCTPGQEIDSTDYFRMEALLSRRIERSKRYLDDVIASYVGRG